MRSALVVMVGVLGCARVEPELLAPVPVAATSVTTCAAVTGDALGRLPLTVALGDESISFAEWSLPDERSTAVVGFAAHLPGGVRFTVKAGDEEFHSTSPRWMHPRGISGPRVHAVERITFCRTTKVQAPAVVAVR